jgi:hypothetical protein
MRISEFGHLRRSRIAHSARPIPPRELLLLTEVMLVKRFEDGKIGERLSSGSLEIAEALPEAALCGRASTKLTVLEASKQRFQHRSLARRDGAVINHLGRACSPVGGPKPLSRHQGVYSLILGETWHRGQVDV